MGSQDSYTFEKWGFQSQVLCVFISGDVPIGMMLDPFFGTMRPSCPWNLEFQKGQYTPEVQQSPWKMRVRILLSFWDDIFSGAMLHFQGVNVVDDVLDSTNIKTLRSKIVEQIIFHFLICRMQINNKNMCHNKLSSLHNKIYISI